MGNAVTLTVAVLCGAFTGWLLGLGGPLLRISRRLDRRLRRPRRGPRVHGARRTRLLRALPGRWTARLVAPVLERLDRPRGGRGLRPSGRPVEQLAADLRRLLAEHDAVSRSPDVVGRAARLRALESAITGCATEAARALGIALPEPGGALVLRPSQLRPLLQSLVEAGLAIPAVDRFGV